MSLENDKKVLCCAMSLFNISVDMKDIDLMVHQITLALSKYLTAKLGDKPPVPHAIIHSQTAPHNTNISEEVESIIKEIRETQV